MNFKHDTQGVEIILIFSLNHIFTSLLEAGGLMEEKQDVKDPLDLTKYRLICVSSRGMPLL